MEANSGFLALVKISAFSRLGICAGLRRLLQMLLVTFSYANLPPRFVRSFACIYNMLKKIKSVTFFTIFFKKFRGAAAVDLHKKK